jgi:Ser/Thr protein kinase RdoA (MazF antagonist)
VSRVPAAVLARYAPALDGLAWVPVGGGFSGAGVWRGDDPTGNPTFALKAWPPEFAPARLAQIHGWLTRVAHLPFVPAVLPAADGRSFVSEAGRLWDLSRWKPGVPLAAPTAAEVEAACAAVARLHAAWHVERLAPAPCVAFRLRALSDFQTYFASTPSVSPTLDPHLRRAHSAVTRTRSWAEQTLRRWEAEPLPLRPCVRDLRGEHVLFSAGTVTGIVDYGAMAVDHAAADLARLLGDLAGEDDELFAAGLRAYREAGGRLGATDEFVRVLDRSGAIGSVVGWFVRLRSGGRNLLGEEAIAARLDRLTGRVERFANR